MFLILFFCLFGGFSLLFHLVLICWCSPGDHYRTTLQCFCCCWRDSYSLRFQIALLRYTSHTVQFTQFKVYNSVALNVFTEFYIHHVINFRTFSLTKEILCPLIITPRISPSFLLYPPCPVLGNH